MYAELPESASASSASSASASASSASEFGNSRLGYRDDVETDVDGLMSLTDPNATDDLSFLLFFDPHQRNVRGSMMILMGIVSLSLNLLLFRVATTRKAPGDSSGSQTIVQHLAVANCLTAVFCLLTKGIWEIVVVWLLGDSMCKLVNGLEKFALYSNTYLVVCLSLHRVIHFMRTENSISASKKRAKYFVLGAWTFSGVCAIPQVFGHKEEVHQPSQLTTCEFDGTYYGEHSDWANYIEGYVHVILLYFIPVLMIITSSTILLGAILRRMKRFGLREEDSERRFVGATASFMTAPPNNNSSGSSSAGNNESNSSSLKRNERKRSRSHSHSHRRERERERDRDRRCNQQEIVTVTHYVYPDRVQQRNLAAPYQNVSTSSQTSISANPFLLTYRNGHLVSLASGSAVSGAETHELVSYGLLRSTPIQNSGDVVRSSILFQRAKLRSIQVAATTIGCYVLCWTPYYVFQLIIFSMPDGSRTDLSFWDITAWLYIVGLSYIIVHPLLYGSIRIRYVRRKLRKICIKPRRKSIKITV